MERIILSFTALFFLSFNADAFPIIDRYYKVLSEKDSHVVKGEASHRELDPSSIKVFVWNIKKTQEVAWQNEFENYTKGQDLVLLQEAYLNDRFNTAVADMPGVRWDMGVGFFYRMYNDTATGTMIGSSVEPSFVKVRHSDDTEPFVGTPKSMTFAKYPTVGNKELLVISVHGINLTTHKSFERQMAQAEREIVLHDGPVIFAGDFNTRTKARTAYLMDLVKRLKLDEVKFKHAEYRMVWKFTKNYLDHGFVRGLKVKSAEVLKDSRGSDHRPLALEVEVTE